MNPLTWFYRTFLDNVALTSHAQLATVITPMPPHVASLRLNMGLLTLHMNQAQRGPDERTRAGYISVTNKEHKS